MSTTAPATTPIPDAKASAEDESSSASDPLPIQPPSAWTPPPEAEYTAASAALIRSLRFAGVKFLRYATVDACNTVRAKAAPLDRVAASGAPRPLENVLSIAEICFAGMPSYADHMTPSTGLDARGVLTLRPDLSSLRVLPYAPKTAMVMGTAHDQRTGELSPLCTRGLLARVSDAAGSELGLAVDVGAELEFCLFRDGRPVDSSIFASTATLNEQEGLIDDLYDQLRAQDIGVELVHSESASGQLELVLEYQRDPVRIADHVFFVRETVRAVAKARGMRAVFLPKVAAMEAGNGCHLHFSIRDLRSDDPSRNALPRAGAAGEISPKGGAFMEGVLDHLPALMGLTVPSVNSFRRVGPGCWTGHCVGWALEDKEAALRACADLTTGEVTHFELKLSDSMANIYLELAAIIAAGLDGVRRGLTLRPALGDGGAEGQPPPLPSTFGKALEFLKKDDFLKHVLGKRLSTAYIALREAEIKQSKEMTLEDEVALALQKE